MRGRTDTSSHRRHISLLLLLHLQEMTHTATESSFSPLCQTFNSCVELDLYSETQSLDLLPVFWRHRTFAFFLTEWELSAESGAERPRLRWSLLIRSSDITLTSEGSISNISAGARLSFWPNVFPQRTFEQVPGNLSAVTLDQL